MDKELLLCGCSIFVLLGCAHLGITLFTDKLRARDKELWDFMTRVSPVLTHEMSMWDAWVGMNMSHSLSVIMFGMLYIVIAQENYEYLKSSWGLNVILLGVPGLYLFLAIRFWFNKPRYAITAALVLIALSIFKRL